MILEFEVEDLMCVAIGEFPKKSSFKITYKRVNNMRDKLRNRGISNDLSLREITTIFHEYPFNIKLEINHLVISKSPQFTVHFKDRISKYDKNDIQLLTRLWKETK